MNEKNIKNEIYKRKSKKVIIFSLIILMTFYLPLTSLATMLNVETEDDLNKTPHISESTLWTNNGEVVCPAPGQQWDPNLINDGEGGVIITWYDDRNSGSTDSDIFAQKINSAGIAQWDINGTIICNEYGKQLNPKIISDGEGGAIITWFDKRNSGTTGYDIYAQKINSAGIIQWDNNGSIICNASDNQISPEIISDESGGAIITWQDFRSMAISSFDIYAQKINSVGSTQWENNGTIICNYIKEQESATITSDGEGGAIITWYDNRNSGTTGYDIYAQNIDSEGIIQWKKNGTVICNASSSQLNPKICSDGQGGAIITWYDKRTMSTTALDIYAQKINLKGFGQWDINGTIICNESGNQIDIQITSDGAGGAIITWSDERRGSSQDDIYAQKINTMGISQWCDNGRLICDAPSEQEGPQITSDGAGGAIIAWQDTRFGDSDIYAQKINSDGMIQWDENWTLICNATGNQLDPQITSDGAGGAIIAWQDERIAIDQDDIYAQKIAGPGDPSIAIHSPINYTLFNSTSGLFNISVSGFSIHTIWYTINGSSINPIWYRMNGDSTQSFTIITTVDDTGWATLANNTLVIVTFFVNDTFGAQASDSLQVYIRQTPQDNGGNGGTSQNNIPGFDLVIIGVLSIIAITTLVKMNEKKKKRV